MRFPKSMLCVLLIFGAPVFGDDNATGYIEFTFDFHAQCVSRNGKMHQVVNKHPDRSIKAYLYRYLSDVRQPGRTAHTLPPQAEPTDLGCSLVDGREQRWDLVKAKFAQD